MVSEIFINIPQIFAETQLVRRGKHWHGRCPFPDHEDKHPSFYVTDSGLWYCFGCRRGGNIRTYLQLMGRLSEPEEHREDGLSSLITSLPPPSEYWWKLLEQRCIPRPLLEELFIREGVECDIGAKLVRNWHSFIGRLIFPHCRNNGTDTSKLDVATLIGWNPALLPRYVYAQGHQIDIPFGLPRAALLAKETKSILVVEGVFDALSAWTYDIAAVATLGSGVKTHRFLPLFPMDWKITLAPDSPILERKGGGFYHSLKWSADAIIAGRWDAEVLIIAPPFKDLNDAHQADYTDVVLEKSRRQNVIDYLCETAIDNNDARKFLSVLRLLPRDVLEETLRKYPQVHEYIRQADTMVRRINTALHIIVIALQSKEGRKTVFNYMMPAELPKQLATIECHDDTLPPYISQEEVEQACQFYARHRRRYLGKKLLDSIQFIWGVCDE